MAQFTDYISDALGRQGYKLLGKSDGDVFLLEPEIYRTTLERKSIWICYLDAEVTPEQIRRMFEFKGHILVVVNEKLIPDNVASRQKTPMWLRVLHGLYLGRIYAWNGRSVFGLHIDYDTGDVSESPALQPTSLLLIETGTWLRGWSGEYKLARFYDNAWWEVRSQPPKTDEDDAWTKGKKSAWEQAYEKAEQQRRDPPRWEYQGQRTPPKDEPRYSYYDPRQGGKNSRSGFNWDAYNKTGYDDPWAKKEPPKQEPPKQDAPKLKTKADYITDFKACGNFAAAKELFKKLLRENHPDLNPGKPNATKIMQEINPAWEYMKDWWT